MDNSCPFCRCSEVEDPNTPPAFLRCLRCKRMRMEADGDLLREIVAPLLKEDK